MRVTQGALQGAAQESGVSAFLGVPYAAPPVGDLRWRPPEAPARWSGVRDATSYAPACAQPLPAGPGHLDPRSREDCLYLNVWTPRPRRGANLPVMLWIHGGGFVDGTGSNPVFSGDALAQRGVVVVTINYRLGALGFFAHPELTQESPHRTSGNYGLADQQAALRWLRDNIRAFGGDPRRVTVFGQSAGAASVTMLMTSPRSRGLFRAAIAQSGSPMLGLGGGSLAAAEQQGAAFATTTGAQSIAELRRLPLEQLFDRWKAFALATGARPGPIVDGWILPRSPAQVFASHDEMRVPLLIGSNAREGLGPIDEDVASRIRSSFGDAASRAAEIYLPDGQTPPPDPILGTAANVLATDLAFRCSAVVTQTWHAHQGSPVYAYQFEASLPRMEQAGAQHSSELMYVFGFTGAGNVGATPLSQTLVTYWTNFAKHLDPNGEGVPYWPRFTPESAEFVHLGVAGVIADVRLRGRACDLYREVVLQRTLNPAH